MSEGMAKMQQRRIEELERERQRLREALELALRESGCDGDLCFYNWHEVARKALGEGK